MLCMRGTLYHKGKNISLQLSTLAELHIDDGDTITLKNYQALSNASLKDFTIHIDPHGPLTIRIPDTLTVQLLKFVIECKYGILATHQVLKRGSERWDQDRNMFHECTREELQQLTLEDTTNKPEDVIENIRTLIASMYSSGPSWTHTEEDTSPTYSRHYTRPHSITGLIRQITTPPTINSSARHRAEVVGTHGQGGSVPPLHLMVSTDSSSTRSYTDGIELASSPKSTHRHGSSVPSLISSADIEHNGVHNRSGVGTDIDCT